MVSLAARCQECSKNESCSDVRTARPLQSLRNRATPKPPHVNPTCGAPVPSIPQPTSCRVEPFVLIYTPRAMPIPENIGAGPAGHDRGRARIPRPEEFRVFWQRVTDGMELQQLWSQFSAEAKESYGLYSREVDWTTIQQQKRWQQPFHAAWALFQAMMMKLSPSRRVLLLLAAFFILFASPALLIFIVNNSEHPSPTVVQFFVAGTVLFFILLALELADRVTMKRDLEIAREIQRWLVPTKPPEIPGVDIAFATRPANTVAGDYYDAFLAGGWRGRRAAADRGCGRGGQERSGGAFDGYVSGQLADAGGSAQSASGACGGIESLCLRAQFEWAAIHYCIFGGAGFEHSRSHLYKCGTQCADSFARFRKNRTARRGRASIWNQRGFQWKRAIRLRVGDYRAGRSVGCFHGRIGGGFRY